MTSDDDSHDPPTTVGAGGDPTAVVPPVTAEAPGFAWSVDDGAEEPIRRQSWGITWGQTAVIAACVLALATAICAAVIATGQTRQRNAPAVSAPMPAWALPPISSAAPSKVAEPAPSTPPVPAPPATSTVTVAAPPPPAPPPTEGMFAICPSGHSGVATTVTSCAFADNVRRAYLAQGGPDVLAYSPVTGDTYNMECIGGFTAHLSDGEVLQAVRCTGGSNAVVVVW